MVVDLPAPFGPRKPRITRSGGKIDMVNRALAAVPLGQSFYRYHVVIFLFVMELLSYYQSPGCSL